jgi:hypothetical protein
MAAVHRMSAVRQGPAAPDDDVARLRVPPHSVEAEQSVLGGLLLDCSAFGVASSIVSEAEFYRYEHRLIFAAIAWAAGTSSPVDVVTVFQRLQELGQAQDCGGLAHLNALAQCVPSAANIRRYAEIVREKATLRRIIAAADEIATAAFAPQGRPLAQLLADAEAVVRRIADAAAPPQSMILDLAALQQRAAAVSWIVKHAIPAESVGVMFGGPGTFKSYIALDLALHVARGLPWLGRRTKQGPAIYIAAEGGTGIAARAKAWHLARRLDPAGSPLYVVPVALDIVADAHVLAQQASRLGIAPALVVVDTLSQTLAGEENNATEVAAYLRALGSAFRELWRCAVLVIHHTGHAATERPRGSSAIKANTDFMFGVFRDEDARIATVHCDRQKDWETFPDVSFSLTSITVGRDADGDEQTQLVASQMRDGAEALDIVRHEASRGRKGRSAIMLELLASMDGQSEKDLRTAFYARAGIESEATKRQAWKRALDFATRSGALLIDNGTVRVLRRTD